MKVTAVKTPPVEVGDDFFALLDKAITDVQEGSVIAVTSKIISLCEKNVIKIGEIEKEELIHKEAGYYLPTNTKYNFNLTIKKGFLLPSAGIDESNGNGYYILWPKDPQKTVNRMREFLRKKFSLSHLGVIITDSKSTPLRWGVTGVTIAYSGFKPLNDYIGTPDIFGRLFKVEKANVADALAVSAVAVMGEGSERTPIAIIEDIPFVQFRKNNPSKEELENWVMSLEEDLYADLLGSVKWKKGKAK